MAGFRYRLIPAPSYDIRRLESWLEDMSEKGWELAAVALCIGIFREGEPGRKPCKIMPADLFPEETREAKLHLCERLGWKCVAGFGGRFLVFSATEEAPGEIPGDEAGSFRRLRRRAGVIFSSVFLSAAAFLSFLFFGVLGRNGICTGLLSKEAAGFLTLAFLLLAGVVWLGDRFFCACRLTASSGRSFLSWRRAGRIRAVMGGFLFALTILGMTIMSIQKNSLRAGNYTEETRLPVLSLAAVAGEPVRDYTGRVTEDGWRIDNSYTANWRLLAPENYRTVQSGETEAGGLEILRAEWKRAAFGWLAKGYYEEKRAFCEGVYGESLELGEGPAWEGVFFSGPEEQILLLRSGCRVVLYRYEGAADLSHFAREAALRPE